MILLDTNILGRVTNSEDSQCVICRRAIDVLRGRGERLVIVPQNVYEFWAIATRPKGKSAGENGLGMGIEQARLWVQFFMRRFTVLVDRPELLETWLDLTATLGIRGFRTHDARLGAAMKTYGIGEVLTINASDFANLGVKVIQPSHV